MTVRSLKNISAVTIAGLSVVALSTLGHLATSPTASQPALMPIVDVAMATPLGASSMPRLADGGDDDSDGPHTRIIAPDRDYDQGRADHGKDCDGAEGGRGGRYGSFDGGKGGRGGDAGPNRNGGDGGNGGSFGGGDGGNGGKGGSCAV